MNRIVVVLAATIAFALTACGDDDDGDSIASLCAKDLSLFKRAYAECEGENLENHDDQEYLDDCRTFLSRANCSTAERAAANRYLSCALSAPDVCSDDGIDGCMHLLEGIACLDDTEDDGVDE